MIDGFDLTGRGALVTGSSRGIGRAIAAALAASGACVAIHHAGEHSRGEAEATADAIGAACILASDLGRDEAPRQLFEDVQRQLGDISILVLNVAVQQRLDLEEGFDSTSFDRQVRINIRSNLELMHLFIPPMREAGWGRIVHVGSVQQDRPGPQLVTYAATKSAMLNVTRNLAKQVATFGITINNLSPGLIATDRTREVTDVPDQRIKWEQAIAMGRIGTPADCAGAALLLCSDAGAYITGIDLRVDGGLSL